MSDIPDNAPSPRLCIVVKWPDFEGYGFNLHAEKSKPGQYIGKVDANSPAEVAGLLEGDRIIEVNGVNIANENHKQVVQRIKAVSNETRLLVLDLKADKYYKSKNIVVRGTQSNVIVKSSAREEKVAPPTPEPEPLPVAVTNGHHHHHLHHDDHDNRSVSSAASSSAASETSSSHPQPASAPAEADRDSAAEVVLEETTAEPPKERCPTPLPEEGDDSSQDGEDEPAHEDFPPPVEDNSSQGSEDKPLEVEEEEEEKEEEEEEEVKPPVEDVPPEEIDLTPSEGELTSVEGNVSEKMSGVEDVGEAAGSSPEPESDLEAEYDNVELAAQVDAAPPPPAAASTTSRRSSSASTAGSHSSRSSDTAHTDPSTQSVMSTSSTPPSSLEPAPAPAPAYAPAPLPARTPAPAPAPTPAPTPAPAPLPAPATTKPAAKPVATNNVYNSSGLNLNMSAAEMRAMLARKKKADPRKDTVDLRKKYEIIQNM